MFNLIIVSDVLGVLSSILMAAPWVLDLRDRRELLEVMAMKPGSVDLHAVQNATAFEFLKGLNRYNRRHAWLMMIGLVLLAASFLLKLL